jgi:Holliday junction resolvase RusA-like endonuclease
MPTGTITLTLPYPPSLNRMYRSVAGRVLISREGRAYKKLIGDLCLMKRVRPMDGDVSLTLTAYRPRRSGDLDNTQKALLDALQGHVYHNDGQIVEIHARREDDKANPRVEVEITQID